jgi:hypothetical protein
MQIMGVLGMGRGVGLGMAWTQLSRNFYHGCMFRRLELS